MTEKLDSLLLLPPPTGCRVPPRATACELAIRRPDDVTIIMDPPLFWYEPTWEAILPAAADAVAQSVGRLGITVAALQSELAAPDSTSGFHQSAARMLTYRPDRYGLSVDDFDDASLIDVRLMIARSASGRFAYSVPQITRWESPASDQQVAGGGWVPATAYPPDVVSDEHLAIKFQQLRALSPRAAILVSLSPLRMDEQWPSILAAKPDGIICDLRDLDHDPFRQATLIRRARAVMDAAGSAALPLLVVPGQVSADDAVKFVALGAAAIAVDDWCDQLIADLVARRSRTNMTSSYQPGSSEWEYVQQLVAYQLTASVERFRGLYESITQVPDDQRLGSYDSRWSDAFPVVSLP